MLVEYLIFDINIGGALRKLGDDVDGLLLRLRILSAVVKI